MRFWRVVKIVLAIAVGIYAVVIVRANWYIRDAKVVMPGGAKVTAHIYKVDRSQPGAVWIKMSVRRQFDSDVIVPDMRIVRPKAVRSPEIPPEVARLASGGSSGSIVVRPDTLTMTNGLVCTRYSAGFIIKGKGRTFDLEQPVFVRAPNSIDAVDLVLVGRRHVTVRAGSATIKLIDARQGRFYGSGAWTPYCAQPDTKYTQGPPPDSFCVRVVQTDTCGPLNCTDIFTDTGQEYEKCTAELIDLYGRSLPMTASYAARTNCERLCTRDGKMARYVAGNGEWLYSFNTRNPGRWMKIRIKFIHPPSPDDKRVLRFKNIPL
jgi:hypothetical protein